MMNTSSFRNDTMVEVEALLEGNRSVEECVPANDTAGRDYHPHLVVSHTVLLVVNFTAILFGNGLIVMLLLRIRVEKSYRVFSFMFSLSLADIGVAIFCVLPLFYEDVSHWEFFLGGDPMCRILRFCQAFWVYTSVYIKATMALDRYVYLCYEQPSASRISKLHPVKLVSIVMLLSLILAIPQPIIWHLSKMRNPFTCVKGEYCIMHLSMRDNNATLQTVYVSYHIVTVFFTPLLVFVFTWGHIILVLFTYRWAKRKNSQLEYHPSEWPTKPSDVFCKCSGARRSHSKKSPQRSPQRKLGTRYAVNDPEQIVIIRLPIQMRRLGVGDPAAEPLTPTPKESNETDLLKGGDSEPTNQNVNNDVDPTEADFQQDPSSDVPAVSKPTNSQQHCAEILPPWELYQHTFQRAQRKATRMTLVTIIAYIVCWFPWVFGSILATTPLFKTQSVIHQLIMLGLLLCHLNSAINPWIYLYFSAILRKELKIICFKLFPFAQPTQRPTRR